MKKLNILLVFAFILTTCLSLSACGNDKENTDYKMEDYFYVTTTNQHKETITISDLMRETKTTFSTSDEIKTSSALKITKIEYDYYMDNISNGHITINENSTNADIIIKEYSKNEIVPIVEYYLSVDKISVNPNTQGYDNLYNLVITFEPIK